MEFTVFIILTFLYLIIGFKFLIKRNIYLFVVVTVILPLTSSLTSLHTRYQISAYYTFAIVLIVYYFMETLTKTRISKSVIIALLSVFTFIAVYFVFYLAFNTNDVQLIDLLKDIKPFLILLLGFVFLDFFKFHQLDWLGTYSKKILKYNCIAAILWFLILNKTNLVSIISDDPYYLMNGGRFSSIGTVYVVFYYIAGLASHRKFSVYDIIFISIPVLLTGNRTIMFLIGLLFIVNMLLSSNNVLLLLKRIMFLIISFLVSVLIIFNIKGELKTRLHSMLNFDVIKDQLLNHRFTPFFHELNNFEWFNYLIGKGLGKAIFIPWFVYRDNIDDFNIYMDNIYMTLYIKYGLLMICPLLVFFAFINNTNTNKRFKTLVLIYFSIIGLTTSFFYQSGFLFTILILASFGFTRRGE